MRFTPDRCAHCGGPPQFFVSEVGLTNEGRLPGCDLFFFCKDDCFFDEVVNFSPPELKKGIDHDERYRDLVSEYERARARFFPTGRLYSNEEKAEIRKFDKDEQAEIERYKDDWYARKLAAGREAVREMKQTYIAHVKQQQAEEHRKRQEKDRDAELKRLEKEQELEARQRDRWKRDREAMEERDYRDYLRDTERQTREFEREEAKVREQEEKRLETKREEAEKLAREQAIEEDKRRDLEKRIQPRPIPEKIRYEHTHILGPSGAGKTTLIQKLILDDFYDPNSKQYTDPPAYIIIDPKGELAERFSRLAMFNEHLRDRIIIIDPLDEPALNLFQAEGVNIAQMSTLFSYIFSTTKVKLTGKQEPCFAFCVRLLANVPQANLFTLMALLDDRVPAPELGRSARRPPNPIFEEAISKLTHPAARHFFENDYYSPIYATTREEIKTRVYAVMRDDYLPQMFNAPERKLDIAECIRKRKIVLVNTRRVTLKAAHQTLGRFIIALAVDAIQNRNGTPQSTWHPVHIVIDEFQDFAEAEQTSDMLRIIRSYNAGAMLAHQEMFCIEFDEGIRSAISTNTSIKYASSPEGRDINYMANDLRCETDFFRTHASKTGTHARFACFVRGLTPPLTHPFLFQVPFGDIDRWPMMTDEQHRALLASNKKALRSTHKPAEGAGLRENRVPPARADDIPIVPHKPRIRPTTADIQAGTISERATAKRPTRAAESTGDDLAKPTRKWDEL